MRAVGQCRRQAQALDNKKSDRAFLVPGRHGQGSLTCWLEKSKLQQNQGIVHDCDFAMKMLELRVCPTAALLWASNPLPCVLILVGDSSEAEDWAA